MSCPHDHDFCDTSPNGCGRTLLLTSTGHISIPSITCLCLCACARVCVTVCLWGWLYLKRANSYCGATTGASAQPGRTAHKQINDHNPADLGLERGKSRKPVRSVSRLRLRRFKEEEGACAFFALALPLPSFLFLR